MQQILGHGGGSWVIFQIGFNGFLGISILGHGCSCCCCGFYTQYMVVVVGVFAVGGSGLGNGIVVGIWLDLVQFVLSCVLVCEDAVVVCWL